MTRTVRIRAGHTSVRVDIDPDGTASVEGTAQPLHVLEAGAGTCRVISGADQQVAYVASGGGGETCWVFVDGETWELDVSHGGERRPRPAAAAGELAAPMPATVVRILTETGRTVQRGDTLLLLEAMKMEMPVRAPRDGRVAAILCREGDRVEAGVGLIEITE